MGAEHRVRYTCEIMSAIVRANTVLQSGAGFEWLDYIFVFERIGYN